MASLLPASCSWKGLLLPAVLGAIAAGCYYVTLASQVQPDYFLQLSEDIREGQTIRGDAYTAIAITGDVQELAKAAIQPGRDGIAIGSQAARDAGSSLLLSDITLQDRAVEPLPGEVRRDLRMRVSYEIDPRLRPGDLFQIKLLRGRASASTDDWSKGEEYVTYGPYRMLRVPDPNNPRSKSERLEIAIPPEAEREFDDLRAHLQPDNRQLYAFLDRYDDND